MKLNVSVTPALFRRGIVWSKSFFVVLVYPLIPRLFLTALAEAELEYNDISSPSIFVNFPVTKQSVDRLVELDLVKADEAENAKAEEGGLPEYKFGSNEEMLAAVGLTSREAQG